MTEAELIFNRSGGNYPRARSPKRTTPLAWMKTKTAAKTGGNIAKKARLELEQKTGQSVVTAQNYLPLPR